MSADQIADIAAPADVRRQFGVGRDGRKGSLLVLPEDLHAPGASEHEVGPKVVVQIRGRHRVRPLVRGPMDPLGKGNVMSAPTRTSRDPAT